MPKKRKGGIARKQKSSMQGKSTYVRKTPASITGTQSSSKRSKHSRLGSTLPINYLAEMIESPRNPPESKRIAYRMAISYYFVEVLDAPHSTHWKGKGGTIALIRKALHMYQNQRRVIRRTLEEIVRCAAEGVMFDGKIEAKDKTGRQIIILPGSIEELLIANYMEAYCGFRQTTFIVNEHRRQQGDERVSVYCVMAAFYRLKPKVDVLQKVQSGGDKQGWINARYNVSKQMEAMQGKLTQEEALTDITGNIFTKNRLFENICRKIIIYSLIKQLTIKHQTHTLFLT